MSKEPNLTVQIRSIAVGGAGVGEVSAQDNGGSDLLGITAFVPFTAVGEKVHARLLQRKDRYVNAELLSVLEPSDERVKPQCPYYTNCGGCELQHISQSGQKRAKEQMIGSALKAGKVSVSVLETLQPLYQASPYGYRRRVSLHIDSSGRVGFYRSNTRSVVPLTSCDIAVPAINEKLSNIQDLGRALQGKISSLQIEADDQGVVAVLNAPYALTKVEVRDVLAHARNFFDNVSVNCSGKETDGIGRRILKLPLSESGTVSLQVPAGHFSQVNWEINRKLVEQILEFSEAERGTEVLDLYAGAGNYSIPLARLGAHVTAVEADRDLVTFGRDNSSRSSLRGKLEFACSSVEAFLKGKQNLSPQVVIANPPRSGLGHVVQMLPKAEKLLLVSCHLPSLVRDLKAIVEQGWAVKTIQPFDMFAQTSYVEVLTVFEKA